MFSDHLEVLKSSTIPSMYYFYIIRCADNTLYSGQTNNLEKRIKEHNSGKSRSAKYTKIRRPITLVYSEKFQSLSEALKREHEVKQFTKLKKEALIQTKLVV